MGQVEEKASMLTGPQFVVSIGIKKNTVCVPFPLDKMEVKRLHSEIILNIKGFAQVISLPGTPFLIYSPRFLKLLFFWLHHVVCRNLLPGLGIEPPHSAAEAQPYPLDFQGSPVSPTFAAVLSHAPRSEVVCLGQFSLWLPNSRGLSPL